MVIAYAQATNGDGLDAAVNGQRVEPEEVRFVGLREKSVALNLAASPHQLGKVEVKFGKGHVRLEFMGAEADASDLSPIVVVAEVAEVLQGRAAAVQRAVESVAALGRQCDEKILEAGFALAENLQESRRARRRIAIVAGFVLVAVAVVWLQRSCAASGEVLGSAGSWPR